jgi:hypothetical protein
VVGSTWALQGRFDMALPGLMLAITSCMCGLARCINKVLDMALFVLQLMRGLMW